MLNTEIIAEKERELPLEISLGSVQMPLLEVLALRPGMLIEFPCPGCFEGQLKVAGVEWGRVRTKIENGQVLMELTEIGPVKLC